MEPGPGSKHELLKIKQSSGFVTMSTRGRGYGSSK
jgi:hypothetical protein